MKNSLLTIALLISAGALSQTLYQENFNTLNLGNLNENVAGTAAGQGNWYSIIGTESDNTSPTNFSIINSPTDASNKVLSITGSSNAGGSRQIAQLGLTTAWTSRTAGNDIIEVEFDFYTGAASSSLNSFRVTIFNGDTTPKILGAIGITKNYTLNSQVHTNLTQGFSYWTAGPGTGNYVFNDLGPEFSAPVSLPDNTWVHFGLSFNKTTGAIKFKDSYNNLNATFQGTEQWPVITAGMDPAALYVQAISGTGNTASAVGIFDNFVVKATNTDTLLNNAQFETISSIISIYPNPVQDLLNIKVASGTIENLQLIDMTGKIIKEIQGSQNNVKTIPVQDLQSGIYFVNIQTEMGTQNHKFIKE
jgi:hypothetical protein